MNKQRLIRWIYRVFYFLGITHLFYFLNRKRQRIITYHNVIPDEFFDEKLPCMGVSHAASVFEKQMELLSQKLVPSDRLGENNSFIVTFDDGYVNNFDIARPILEKRGIRGCFFVPLAVVDSQEPLWVDKFLLWASFVPEGSYRILGEECTVTGGESRSRLFEKMWRYFRRNYPRKEELLNELESLYAFENIDIPEPLQRLRFTGLSREQIEAMKRSGHKVAAHSVRHDILSLLSEKELTEDFEATEKEIGKLFNSTIYAYPFGGEEEVGEREIEAVRHSGFTHAVVNISHPNYTYTRHSLPRLLLPNTENPYVVHAKASGLEYFLKYRSLLPNIKDHL